MKISKFVNTIKFKLILWISLLLIISTAGTFYFVNSSISSYYNAFPVQNRFLMNPRADDDLIKTINDDRNALQDKVFLTSLLAVIVQIVICSIGSYLLIKQMIDPLEEVNKLIKEINGKMLYKRVDIAGQSEEMNELICSFNEMMDRLNIAFTGQKQFVENVSHEIKTPLTIIKTNLESITYQKNISKDEMKEAVNTSINSIKFLNNLIDNLLLLSFLNDQKVKLEKVNINQLLKSIIGDVKELAKDKNISISSKIGAEDIIVLGNEILLKRAISNIVENAIKYTKENEQVLINSSKDKKNILINVNNFGNVIANQYKEKIFERFFRADKSRSRLTGGSGLGLSIAKEIVNIFKGDITLTTDNKSNTFTIILPIHES